VDLPEENVGAVVLLSGGVDSTTCLALAVRDHGVPATLALSFDYGQKHRAEIEHARTVAQHYSVQHQVVQLPNVFRGSGSTLIDGGPSNPVVSYDELAEGQSPAYVPFRNGLMLSTATALALVREAQAVYFGAHAEDGQRWAYPDCTPEFIGSMANAVFVGTYFKVRLLSPLQWLTKREVVGVGLSLEAPYQLTLSCYDGREPACGICPTCRSRRSAFRANGLEDPIPYAQPEKRVTSIGLEVGEHR
jgi:7-cyano-7-deazaguanine synthase